MTIREIEELSGMTRANIRFYEKEGLIAPERNSNGYRNYSEEDLSILKRIRLLRTLHLSLEDIKSLSRNEQELSGLLIRHLTALKKEQQALGHSVKVCEQLCKDRAVYSSFDAQHYLDLLDTSVSELPSELKEDTMPKVTSPWIRYFARSIDAAIYMILWNMFLSLVLHINIMETGFAGLVADLIAYNCLFLLAEPLMLSRFGTTPGKFLFGLRVTAETGARLTHGEALHRTWTVLKKGCGFNLPVYWIIRMYKSYRACKDGETLDWEQETLLWLNDRYIPLKVSGSVVILTLLNTLALLLVWQAGALPQNRGDLTVEQYAENFNDMEKYFGIDRQLNLPGDSSFYGILMDDSRLILNKDGEWEKMPGTPYVTGTSENYAELPQLDYTVEDGVITGLNFSASYENEDITIASYGDLMAVSALAFLCAQDDYHLLPDAPSLLYTQIKLNGDNFSGFTINEAGVTVSCTVEYEGYELRPDVWSTDQVLVPAYESKPSFSINFSVTKA